MYLLESVEQMLGPIDTWPTYIIQYLFIDVPSEPIVKSLAIFFYGNYSCKHCYTILFCM